MTSSSAYRPEIDGMRALAVMAVVIYHFNSEALPSGYLGVDIFFVISGYVITLSLAKRRATSLWHLISDFYARRIRRLVPALTIFVLITSLLISLVNPEAEVDIATGIRALLGISNLYLQKLSADYFSQATELNPFTHTWSLGVEEQFYFVFPLLVWLSGLARQSARGARNLMLIVAPMSLLSLGLFVAANQAEDPSAYFAMPPRFWELGAGCLAYLATQTRCRLVERLGQTPAWAALAAVIAILFMPSESIEPATIGIVASSVLLLFCLRGGGMVYRLATNKRMVFVGLISYSLYLWHWCVLSISRWTIGIHWWTVPFQLGLMFLLAILSYRYIELPLRQRQWFAATWQTLLSGIGILAVSAIGLSAVNASLNESLYLGAHRKHGQGSHNGLMDQKVVGTGIEANRCHAGSHDSDQKMDQIFAGCNSPQRPAPQQRTIAFLGDSHALSLMSAERKVLERGFRLSHYSASGCPFPRPSFGIKPKECSRFLVKAESALLHELGPGDTIVILNYHLSHLGDRHLLDTRHHIRDQQGLYPEGAAEKRELYLRGLKDFAAKAHAKGIRIVLIGSGMRNNLLEETREEWFNPFPPDVLVKERENATDLNGFFKAGLRGVPGISVFDPIDELRECCTSVSRFRQYFRDTDHYSAYGAAVLMEDLLNKLAAPQPSSRALPR